MIDVLSMFHVCWEADLLPLRTNCLGGLFVLHSEADQHLGSDVQIELCPRTARGRGRPALLIAAAALAIGDARVKPGLRTPLQSLHEEADEIRPLPHVMLGHLFLESLNLHDNHHVFLFSSNGDELGVRLELPIVPLLLLSCRVRHKGLMELLSLLGEVHQPLQETLLGSRSTRARGLVRRTSRTLLTLAARADHGKPVGTP